MKGVHKLCSNVYHGELLEKSRMYEDPDLLKW